MNSQGGVRRSERLSSRQRLHDPDEFQAVYAARDSVRSRSVVLCFVRNGLKHSRLGVSVSRKYGNAVRRNRIKRVFRAAFRQCQHELPAGYDYVLIPRHGVEEYYTAVVVEELRRAVPKIASGGSVRKSGDRVTSAEQPG
ncbi:MAG TPA: ribonuclease P protein component [Planctomycetota bacterium]|nr:ribonuclease P protein component [Planctomycetota bacterium]